MDDKKPKSSNALFMEYLTENIIRYSGIGMHEQRIRYLEKKIELLEAVIENLMVKTDINIEENDGEVIQTVDSFVYLDALGEEYKPSCTHVEYCRKCDVLFEKTETHYCEVHEALI